MHLQGRYKGASISLEGSVIVSFEVFDKVKALEEIEAIRGTERLTIDAVKYRKPRSLNANRYFWQLTDKIAKKLGSDKWTIYIMYISRSGVFVDMAIKKKAFERLKASDSFRYIEVMHEYEEDEEEFLEVRCYYGSHLYNTEEMAYIINSAVEDAKALGIETMTPDEINHLITTWEAGKE